MLTFLQYLAEGNPLAKIEKHAERGDNIGTISPEREGMNREQKKIAHKKIQAALRRESDKGMISFTGPHKGRYQYSDTHEPAKEGSYTLTLGKHPKAKSNFHRIITHLGAKFKQESILKAKKSGDGPVKGRLHFTTGKDKGSVMPLGSIHYNRELKTGSGDTKFKGKDASFTFKE